MDMIGLAKRCRPQEMEIENSRYDLKRMEINLNGVGKKRNADPALVVSIS
jgi:hypothetical protein